MVSPGASFFYIVRDIFEEIKLLLSERWIEKSDVFNETKHYDYALIACEKAILLNPQNTSAYLSKGSLLWHLKRYEEALNVYEQLINIAPDNILALISLAYALLTLGRYQAALQTCEQVVRFDPENVAAHLFRGYLYGLLRDQAYQRAKQIGSERWQEQLNSKYLIMKPDNLSLFKDHK